MDIADFVTGPNGGVGGEHHALAHFFDGAEILVELESQGKRMRFVHVIDVGAAQRLHHLGATDAEHDALGDAGRLVVVVEAVGDGASEVVVLLLLIGGEEVERNGAESLGRQVVGLHLDLVLVDENGHDEVRHLEEGVAPFPEENAHLVLLIAGLLVVTQLPEHADPDQVLIEVVGAAHVRSRQIAQSSRINLQGRVDPELHAEIGDPLAVCRDGLVGVFPLAIALRSHDGVCRRGTLPTMAERPPKVGKWGKFAGRRGEKPGE